MANRSSAMLVAVLVLAGCASHPKTVVRYAYDHAPTYAEGIEEGRRQTLDALRRSPAFEVSGDAASHTSDAVSWLPHGIKKIPQIVWWGARQKDFDLLDACRTQSDAKTRVIDRMRRRIGLR